MMKKNKLLIVFYIIILSILTSCADVKQGLTGQNKKNGTDEYLIKGCALFIGFHLILDTWEMQQCTKKIG